MIRKLTLALLMSGTALIAQAPALAQTPAPVSKLVDAVNIPHEKFTLDNGLTVLVHEDRKAPIVAVSIWYGVGSKNEPKGKTGYAHLFEHIMFNGSENAPGDYFEYTKKIGATDLNGSTWLDRTNYFQTVPTTALESALFLESDRMGYLLNAVSKEKLDNQIGVVSNEKRQGDNQPFGLVSYTQSGTLFPVGHPYHHSTTIMVRTTLFLCWQVTSMRHKQNHWSKNGSARLSAAKMWPQSMRLCQRSKKTSKSS